VLRWLPPAWLTVGLLTVALMLSGCTGGGSVQDRATSPAVVPSSPTNPPTTASGCATPMVPAPTGPAGQSVFLHDPSFPVALAWAPDGRLFFADRDGVIRTDARGTLRTFATVKTVTVQPGGGYSERGLLGLAISPTFLTDRLVYALYSSADYKHTVVVRWTDCRGVGIDERTLITLPAGPDCCHKGGRLDFGPDGKLYVTIGDEHSVPAPPGGPNPPNPQNTADPRGKVLRFDPDGTVPTDNPFGPTDPVWVAGLRNPFGIAFGPSGQVFVTSNGPTGDAGSPPTGYDLALTVTAGEIFQWPYCYGYSHPIRPYTGCDGRPPPDWSSEGTTIVPTGATWVDDAGPRPMAGHFVFCSDEGGMFIFSPGSPHATVTKGPPDCHLDVKEGPDHALYFSDETDIYRLS